MRSKNQAPLMSYMVRKFWILLRRWPLMQNTWSKNKHWPYDDWCEDKKKRFFWKRFGVRNFIVLPGFCTSRRLSYARHLGVRL